MIDRIIDGSARNKSPVLIVVLAGCLWGAWCMLNAPMDATPDLGQTQVIILSRWDRSPDIIEDQVTYPIIAALTGAPKVKTVRGISDFGYSFVYVVFEDGTDIYWARSRTTEYLSAVREKLPPGVKSELGPDATGLGWIYQYALVDKSGKHNLAELRSVQEWYLKYHLKSIPGVSEVATVGGFTQQFQVNVDPNRLRFYGIPISRVSDAVRASNVETGARVLESAGAEYMVRGRGYLKSVKDLEDTVLMAEKGSPILIKDVASVTLGPDMRRGVSDLNGTGEVIAGIVVMREGSNAAQVIDRVKSKLKEIQAGLPQGVEVVPVYDRSDLIQRSVASARLTVIEVIFTVVLITLIFLWHFPSAAIPIVTIPVSILLTFIPLRLLGIGINIMTLAGIAIACGALVDAAIVVVEQSHKKLETYNRSGGVFRQREVILEAVKEVAGPTFFALLVIAVAFLPVLALEGAEGKLFRPLALSKSFAMLIAALLAITLDPVLRVILSSTTDASQKENRWKRIWNSLMQVRVTAEEQHFISGRLMRCYDPIVRWTLRHKAVVITLALAAVALTLPVFSLLRSEYMPPLNEGTLLYMPSTMPGISITEAQRVLQATDAVLKQFPEVDSVLGKAGRADTATDPAPLSMLETVIVLKPESQWRRRQVWYSGWAPQWTLPLLRHVTSDHISQEQLIAEMDQAVKIPGLSNSWTMPIRGRTEMLSSGMRSAVGIKIQGPDLQKIQELGRQVETVLKGVPGTRSVFAERTGDGYFLDIEWDRKALARYGLSMEDAQRVLSIAVGGENVSVTIQGRERYPVNVRYLRDYRSDVDALGKVLVPAGEGSQIPLAQLASLKMQSGPAMVRDEDGMLTGYVYVDIGSQAPVSYVENAQAELARKVTLPAGYAILWSGEYESAQRMRQRLRLIIPLTATIILGLLYLNTRSLTKTAIVVLAVPFSLVGAIWAVYLLGYHMSLAVWIGMIALMGIDAETGVFMLLYLDLAYNKARSKGQRFIRRDLYNAIIEGAARRIRPKFMTFATMSLGLIPVLWSVGTGSEIMKRVAAPMVGGIFTSFLLELLVYPAIYALWREGSLDELPHTSRVQENSECAIPEPR